MKKNENLDLKKIKSGVANIRRPIGGLAQQLYMIIDAGGDYTVSEMSEVMGLPEKRVRMLLSTLWKRGYLVSPIKEGSIKEEGKLKIITKKKSWFLEAIKRRKDRFLIPHLQNIVSGISVASQGNKRLVSASTILLNEAKDVYNDNIKNI